MAFGGIALFALTGRTGITNYRGSILPCEIDGVSFDKKVVPAFHPATVIKPKNQFLNRKLIVHDMERMRNIRIKCQIENIMHPLGTKYTHPIFLKKRYINQ